MAMATGWLGGIGRYPPHPSRLCNTPSLPTDIRRYYQPLMI